MPKETQAVLKRKEQKTLPKNETTNEMKRQNLDKVGKVSLILKWIRTVNICVHHSTIWNWIKKSAFFLVYHETFKQLAVKRLKSTFEHFDIVMRCNSLRYSEWYAVLLFRVSTLFVQLGSVSKTSKYITRYRASVVAIVKSMRE